MKLDFSKIYDMIHVMKLHAQETAKTVYASKYPYANDVWADGYKTALETLEASAHNLQKTANDNNTIKEFEEMVIGLLDGNFINEAAHRLKIAKAITIPEQFTINLIQMREMLKEFQSRARELAPEEMRGAGVALSRFMYYLDLFKFAKVLGENGDYSDLMFEAYAKAEVMMPGDMDPEFCNGYRFMCNVIKDKFRSVLHKEGVDTINWCETELVGVII